MSGDPLCPAHASEEAYRRGLFACTCGPVWLYQCEWCDTYNVPKKLPGIGYVCDACQEAEGVDYALGWMG